MTTAEMLRREGEARGEARGKREALLLLLRQRFGRIPAAAVARIDRADAVQLDLWFGTVLTAASLEGVLETVTPPDKTMQPTRARARGARQRTRS